MSIIERVLPKTKAAFVCFVCGKMMSIPSAYYILAGDKEAALFSISLYSGMVFMSFVLSYLDLKNIKQGRHEVLNHFNSISADEDATYTVKVVDGKMIIVK